MKRIAMWSGPRNISTALMRSWENRTDTVVVDEPFYGFYLQHSGIHHPMHDAVVASMSSDWRVVSESLLRRTSECHSIFYQKQMAHHMLPQVGLDWCDELEHAFLIRDPTEMIPSLHEKLETFELEATGLPMQLALFQRLTNLGRRPPVIDSRHVLEQPRRQLEQLCTCFDIPFQAEMLAWPAGPRDSDGVWASHWYANVEASTGFQTYKPSRRPIPAHLMDVYDDAMRLYEQLVPHCL